MFLIATESFTVHNLSDFACCLISALMALFLRFIQIFIQSLFLFKVLFNTDYIFES